MHRQPLLTSLSLYHQFWEDKLALFSETPDTLHKIRNFVSREPHCFERTCSEGHITGSAMVVSEDFSSVLLTLHKKLNAWLQLGGHSDGHPHPWEVAHREAEEESGLASLDLISPPSPLSPLRTPNPSQDSLPIPFDLDCHVIPKHRDEAAHIHYDIRYLVLGNVNQPLQISSESQDLRWFTLFEAEALTAEPSMQRQFAKVRWIKTLLSPSQTN